MAQNIENKGVNDCRIDTIIAKQIKVNKFKRGVDGYRVQIHHNQSQSRRVAKISITIFI